MATTKKQTALPEEVFAVEVKNHELLKLAYNTYLAEARTNAAHTMTRGEIRGGGKKPWRQKGTGRARFGSSRNPIWRGGGIVFGPRGNENFKLNINKSAKRVAIRQALTLAAQADKIVVLDTISFSGKTKEAAALLADNGVAEGRRALIVVDAKDQNAIRATNNLVDAKLVSAKYLNVYDVLNADRIIIAQAALPIVQEWLGGKS
ncbi:50S ribosomal protein L4 [Candidatus Saccharibacteria bacterium]|nr:50S ribosomal protein L4 [Candidatus Saccharibacteria bacterium]